MSSSFGLVVGDAVRRIGYMCMFIDQLHALGQSDMASPWFWKQPFVYIESDVLEWNDNPTFRALQKTYNYNAPRRTIDERQSEPYPGLVTSTGWPLKTHRIIPSTRDQRDRSSTPFGVTRSSQRTYHLQR